MDVNLFDYDLPPEAIAQQPVERGTSRMLVTERGVNRKVDSVVSDLPRYLNPGDLLVLNDSRVIPARLHGTLETGGKVEIFLTSPLTENRWEALTRPAKKMKVGTRIHFPGGETLSVVERGESGLRVVESTINMRELLALHGKVPLPPYIQRPPDEEDKEWYQTIFAREDGSVAAPTAGLHFTENILEELRSSGIEIATVTLHVSIGTFRPVAVEDTDQHKMDTEHYSISQKTADQINAAIGRNARIVAVGTTSVRTLEAAYRKETGGFEPVEESTNLFIVPGYRFNVVDAILTNFHLPKSSLIMLVSALAGRERVLNLYKHAIDSGYRFYSYGDCMLLI